jgi:ABC-type glycerol-3-phosphate transport system permease component
MVVAGRRMNLTTAQITEYYARKATNHKRIISGQLIIVLPNQLLFISLQRIFVYRGQVVPYFVA